MSEVQNELLSSADGEPLTEPMAISDTVARSLASALAKIETYVPTAWVDNSEPDIDAEHLNHAEQAIMRVTDLLNGAVDVIQDLQTQVTKNATDIGVVNNNLQGPDMYYNDAQLCLEGIYNWIMAAPERILVSKNIYASFQGNILGELNSGNFQLVGYHNGNYAGIMAISYWDNRKLLLATIENGEWKTKFEKCVTNSDYAKTNVIGTYRDVGIYATEDVTKYSMLLFRLLIGTSYMFQLLPVSVVYSSIGGGWRFLTETGYIVFRFQNATTFQIANINDSNFKDITIYGL